MARRLLREARKANKHVPAYLLGEELLPEGPPASYVPGEPSEAIQYAGGYLAPAKASEWTDYSLEGDATTSNTLAVSFRQSGNNGPSLQFSAGTNSLGPLRLSNGGWSADGSSGGPT